MPKIISQPSEPEMINPFEQMMGGTDIGKIAQEVSQSLDFEALLGDVNSKSYGYSTKFNRVTQWVKLWVRFTVL